MNSSPKRLGRSPIRLKITHAFLIIILGLPASAAAQAVCQYCGYQTDYQSPVASPGGPYIGMTPQAVQLDGSNSYGAQSPITDYYWDFGDGTAGTGAYPNHQYSQDGIYEVWLTVCDEAGNCGWSQTFVTVNSVDLPVRINFEGLPNNTVVADQYLAQYGVRFYSSNYIYPVHTYQNCGFCSTTSPPNFLTTLPDTGGQVTAEFTQPVSNLTFYMIGVDSFYNLFGYLDVYRNGTFYQTYPIYGNGTFTVGFTLGSLTNVSKIVVRSLNDPLGVGFDDFTFSLPSDIKITNARVNGYLNGTSQNALLAADVALNASPLPSGFAGGTYSWTFSGSPTILTAVNQSSVSVRWNQTGTYRATITYSKNGLVTSGYVDVSVILPTLSSFTASVAPDRITRDQHCGGIPSNFLGARYSLGCYQVGGPDDGIIFTANAQIPSGQYLSNPAQSGIKIKQFISQYRKRVNDTNNGNFECATVRSSPTDVDSGWQLDGSEAMTSFVHPPPTFAQGNSLTYSAFDAPGDSLDLTFDNIFSMRDVFFADERFQAYVDYYVGNPLSPTFQRPLKLASHNSNFSYIGWRWNGQAKFAPSESLKYMLQFTNTPSLFLSGTNSLPALHGNVNDTHYGQCAGDPQPSTNMIDGAKCFVIQQYWDFLKRGPDQPGLDYWTGEIATCEFDRGCISFRRKNDAYAFFLSAEFQNIDPAMANPPGSAGFDPAVYNPAFIRHCYENFLGRAPDGPGMTYWLNDLNSNGDYLHMIEAFIVSIEYRGRADFHSCF